MAQSVLVARERQKTGKGVARKLRQQGQVPAVFYGPNADPMKLTVDYGALEDVLQGVSGENVILDLEVHGEGGTQTKTAMLKELQTDPVHERFLHADFFEISMDKEITVNVSIQLIGTPVGVTNGGILENIRREVSVSCLPGKLVDAIDVDISAMDIGDAVHMQDLQFPDGVRPLEDENLTVAIISAPAVEKEEVEEGVEEAEEVAAESEETSVGESGDE